VPGAGGVTVSSRLHAAIASATAAARPSEATRVGVMRLAQDSRRRSFTAV
jgi:hypothetical protein